MFWSRSRKHPAAQGAEDGESVRVGQKAYLLANSGAFVEVDENGNVLASRGERIPGCELVIEKFGSKTLGNHDTIYLRAWTGKRIDVQGHRVKARIAEHSGLQALVLEKLGGGPVRYGDQVYLCATSGCLLEVDDVPPFRLVAGTAQRIEDKAFTIVDAAALPAAAGGDVEAGPSALRSAAAEPAPAPLGAFSSPDNSFSGAEAISPQASPRHREQPSAPGFPEEMQLQLPGEVPLSPGSPEADRGSALGAIPEEDAEPMPRPLPLPLPLPPPPLSMHLIEEGRDEGPRTRTPEESGRTQAVPARTSTLDQYSAAVERLNSRLNPKHPLESEAAQFCEPSRCPEKHPLRSHVTAADGWQCNRCGRRVDTGCELWGCWRCNWDICADCYDPQVGDILPWLQPVHISDDVYIWRVKVGSYPDTPAFKYNHFPWFTLIMTVCQFCSYLGHAYLYDRSLPRSMRGAAGPTGFYMMPYDTNCVDIRDELVRLWAYQFCHGSVTHLLGNCLGQMIIMWHFEAAQGSKRVGGLYTLGVITGAFTAGAFDPHTAVLGSSGGLWCMLFARMVNIMLNWRSMRGVDYWVFSNLTCRLTFSFVFFMYDVLNYALSYNQNTSYYAHTGGAVTGIFLGAFMLKNLNLERVCGVPERVVVNGFALMFLVYFGVCVLWYTFGGPFQGLTEALSGTPEHCRYGNITRSN